MKQGSTFAIGMAVLVTFSPSAGALERIYGMSREARDVRTWLADEPRNEGMEAAGIHWRPTLPLGLRYDDNIYASDAREEGDAIFSATPSVLGEAKFGEHAFGVSAYVRSDQYFDEGSESNTEYGAAGEARFKLLQWLDLSGRYRYDRLNEGRDSPDIPLTTDEQPDFEQWSAKAGLHPHFGRFFSDFEFLAADITYDELEMLDGTVASQSYRNRDSVHLFGTFGYEISPAFRPYVQFIWNDHGYDDWPIDRDGGGKSVFGGARFSVDDRLTGNVYAGYTFQNFGDDDFRLEEQKGIGFGVELDWQASDVVRLRIDALREIEEATTDFESGRFATMVLLRGAYRYSEMITIEGLAGYEHDAYGTSPRKEDFFRIGAGLLAEFGRHLYSRLAWQFADRDSNAAGRSYDRNVVMLTVGLRF